MGSLVVCVLALIALHPTSARHGGKLVRINVKLAHYCFSTVDGEPPSFITEPEQQVVVSSAVSQTVQGLTGNLVLQCVVRGNPTPTISWFMEGAPIDSSFVTTDNTLVLPVTEGVQATRTGVLYHCVASNMIGHPGSEYTASIRSRDANVTYTCMLIVSTRLPNYTLLVIAKMH